MASPALHAAQTGSVPALQKALSAFPPPDLDAASINQTTDQLVCAASHNGHASTLSWLLETRFPAHTPRLDAHLAALYGGPEVYEVFLRKWPHLIDYELGHNGNPIGLAVFRNDKRMVRFLLGRGVDPNTAMFGNKLFNKPENFPTWCKHVDKEIIDLLVEYGFEVPEAPEQEGLWRRWRRWMS